MPYYSILTAEQKRRKQAIRNWRRQGQELFDSYEFAVICKDRILKDKIILANKKIDSIMSSTCLNLSYSLKDIFREHDKQDEMKYHSEVLAESVVDYLLNE